MYENHTWTANVITLFPEMFPGALSYSLIGKALKNNLWNYKIEKENYNHNWRRYSCL